MAEKGNKWVALSVISIATLMSTLDGGMMSVSYPALAEAFDADTSTVLWVVVAFWVTNVGLLLTLGWLGDVAGRRRVFTLGFVVFTIGILIAAASLNIWQLIGARIFQAFGSAMLLSNLNALIAASFPSNERGKALGISGAVVGVGLSAGPLAGGLLLDTFDWRALFYSRLPLGLLGAGLAWRLLPPDRVERREFRMDLLGAFALFGTLGSFLLAVNQGGRLGFGTPTVIGLAIAARASSCRSWSGRSAGPCAPSSILLCSDAPTMLSGFRCRPATICRTAPSCCWRRFFFVGALGFSPTRMGLYVAAFYVGRAFLAPVAGRLSDTFGPRPFLVFGNLLLAAALLWLSRLGTGADEGAILSAMLLSGVGSALFEPVATSVIMGSVPQDRLGTASASVATGTSARILSRRGCGGRNLRHPRKGPPGRYGCNRDRSGDRRDRGYRQGLQRYAPGRGRAGTDSRGAVAVSPPVAAVTRTAPARRRVRRDIVVVGWEAGSGPTSAFSFSISGSPDPWFDGLTTNGKFTHPFVPSRCRRHRIGGSSPDESGRIERPVPSINSGQALSEVEGSLSKPALSGVEGDPLW